MKKRTTILTLALVMAFAAATAFAGGEGKAKTVEGTLVDSKCHSIAPQANAGNDHMTPKGMMPNCGTACAKMGIPVNLLTAEGKVYTLAVPAPVIADQVGKKARVSGDLFQGTLVVNKLEVKEGNVWKEVPIVTMM